MRHGFRFLLVALLPMGLAVVLPLAIARSSTAAPPPSVVLITIDTVRADALPMWGASDTKTPALQGLAEQGVVFSQVITPVPLTLPAHVSLMTGTEPSFHGVRDNSGNRLSGRIPTLAVLLKQQGYATAAFVGSSVLDRRFGLSAGFDYYGDQFKGSDLHNVAAERDAGVVVDEAQGWLANRKTEPFFVWIHLYDPHAPYAAPGAFRSRGYKGEIEYCDTQIQRLFDSLKKEARFAPSLVIVLSDHGEDLNQHGEPTHGFFIYDSVLRIPLIVKLPDSRFAGVRVDQQVRTVDVFPTVLQILRAPSPPVAGKGLLRMMLGKEAVLEEREAFSETLYPSLHFGWSALFSLRSRGFKYIEAPQPEFYDLSRDPGEKENLFSSKTALANQFRQRLKEFRSRGSSANAPERVDLDPELKERLQTLGYATLSSGSGAQRSWDGPDPKSKIEVYAEIYKGMEAYVQKDLQAARLHFEKAIGRDSQVPLSYNYLGSTLLALQQPGPAIAAYKEAARLSPGALEITLNLAHAYLQNGQTVEAIEGFRHVTRSNPEDWQAWQLLGVSLSRENRLVEATGAFQQALEKSPSNRQILYNLGNVYEKQRQFLKAVEIFRRLVELDTGDAEAWNSLASNYQGSGLLELAERAYQAAIERKPDYDSAHYNYGNLLARLGKLAAAEAEYRRAVEANPEFTQAYHNLAVILEGQGRVEDAARARSRFEELQKKP